MSTQRDVTGAKCLAIRHLNPKHTREPQHLHQQTEKKNDYAERAKIDLQAIRLFSAEDQDSPRIAKNLRAVRVRAFANGSVLGRCDWVCA